LGEKGSPHEHNLRPAKRTLVSRYLYKEYAKHVLKRGLLILQSVVSYRSYQAWSKGEVFHRRESDAKNISAWGKRRHYSHQPLTSPRPPHNKPFQPLLKLPHLPHHLRTPLLLPHIPEPEHLPLPIRLLLPRKGHPQLRLPAQREAAAAVPRERAERQRLRAVVGGRAGTVCERGRPRLER